MTQNKSRMLVWLSNNYHYYCLWLLFVWSVFLEITSS